MNITEVTRNAALGAIAAVLIAGGISMALAPGTVRQAASAPASFAPFGDRHDDDDAPVEEDRSAGEDERSATVEREPSGTVTPTPGQPSSVESSVADAGDNTPAPAPTEVPPTATAPATTEPHSPGASVTPDPGDEPSEDPDPTTVPTVIPGPEDLAPKPTLTVVPIDPCLVVDCDEPDPSPTVEIPDIDWCNVIDCEPTPGPTVVTPGTQDEVLPKLTPVVTPKPALDDLRLGGMSLDE